MAELRAAVVEYLRAHPDLWELDDKAIFRHLQEHGLYSIKTAWIDSHIGRYLELAGGRESWPRGREKVGA